MLSRRLTFILWKREPSHFPVVYVIVAVIAYYQSDKLLEESKEEVNIKVTIKGDIKPEDVEVSIDSFHSK